MGFLSSLGGLLGGGSSSSGGPLGSIVDGITSSILMNSSNAKAKRQWQRERGWQETMMKNAHQWELEDLKKAGINPSLTAGTGGATGSGVPNADTSHVGSGLGLGNAFQTAFQNLNTIEQLNINKGLADSTNNKNNASATKDMVTAGLMPEQAQQATRESNARIAEYQQNINESKTRQANINQDTMLKAEQVTAQTIENEINKAIKEFETGNFAMGMRYVDKVIDTAKNAGGVFASIAGTVIGMKGLGTAKEGMKTAKELASALKELNGTTIGKMIKAYGKSKK